MAQARAPKKRRKTSAKNRPQDESLFVEKAFAQMVAAVRTYASARTTAWSRKRLPAAARGLKSAKLQLAKRLTEQVDRITESGIPLTRREKVALEYVVLNSANSKRDADKIDIDSWTVFRSADDGDSLRDVVMNVNLSWMMERIILARER